METNISYCDDTVIEILTRLPVKSLMRFKRVSKDWNTLIRHPNFVRSYSARSQTRLLFQLVVNHHQWYCHRDSLASESEVFPLELNCFSDDGDQMSICSNHCNGLVCLYSNRYMEVYLYNVTTREMKALSSSINHDIITSKKYGSNPMLFLGFDGNCYKLLHVFDSRGGGGKEGKIVTLGVINSSWRKIDLLNEYYESCTFCIECIFLNKVVYWDSEKCVVYFNFSEEEFGYILPPESRYSFRGANGIQTALSGKLVMYSSCSLSDQCLLVYDDANKIFTEVPGSREKPIKVMVTLLGEERMNDESSNTAHVLATASVVSAPASLFCSSLRPFRFKFVGCFDGRHRRTTSSIAVKYVTSFVDNIIPLSSLIV